MKSFIGRLFFVAFVLFVTLFLVELGLRFFVQSSYGVPSGAFIADDVLDYRPKPGFHGLFINPEHPLREIPLDINSYGFRGPEFSVEKPSFVKRIIVLGDSMTMAEQVPYNETYAYQLQTLLNKKSTYQWEVLNLGVSGYGTRQAFDFYQLIGEQFHPDIIIYAFTHNDLEDNLVHRYTIIDGERVDYSYLDKPLWFVRTKIFFYRHSALLRTLYRAFTFSSGSSSLRESPLSWQTFSSVISTAHDKNSVPFVVLYNVPRSVYLGSSDVDMSLLSDVLSQQRIPLLVPDSSLAMYFPIDSHWNTQGHELVAQTLYNYLSVHFVL